jgi:hypothetical protein
MVRAFIWGFGWTFGRYAAMLCIFGVVLFFTSPDFRKIVGMVVLYIVLGVGGLIMWTTENDRRTVAYAVCMKAPPPIPDFWTTGVDNYCSYKAKSVSYQREVGARKPDDWF